MFPTIKPEGSYFEYHDMVGVECTHTYKGLPCTKVNSATYYYVNSATDYYTYLYIPLYTCIHFGNKQI